MKRFLLSVVVLVSWRTELRAAPLWIIADMNRVNEGDAVWLALVSGAIFPVADDPSAALENSEIVDRGPAHSRPLLGWKKQGSSLTMRRPLDGVGVHVIGCDPGRAVDEAKLAQEIGTATPSSLSAADVSAMRFAKTVVTVDPVDRDDRGYSIPLGHALEILPLSDLSEWRVGQYVRAQVLVEGRPRMEVRVRVGHEGDAECADCTALTPDEKGLVSFTPRRSGHWFLLAEVERISSGASSARRSMQATLTFRVRGEKDVSPALQSVRAIHGDLDPAAVAGYRMAAGALEVLGLRAGSSELSVMHWAPMDARFAGTVDGVQASTHTSPGRMNLRLEEAPSPEDIQTICTNRATGQRVICRLRLGLRHMIETTVPGDRQDAAMRIAIMPDEWVFELTRPTGEPARVEPPIAFRKDAGR